MAMDPQAYKEIIDASGEAVGSLLRSRFYSKQAEMFSANELAKFQAESAAFNDALNQFTDPNSDDFANSFRQYQNGVVMPFMTQASLKYGENPQIMKVIQGIDKANRDGLEMFLGVKDMQQKDREVGVKEDQEERLNESEKKAEGREAQMHPLRMGEMRAQTSMHQAQAEYYGRLPKDTTGKGLTADPYAVIRDARRLKKVDAESLDGRTIQDVLTRITTKHKNQLYPSGAGVWGTDPEQDQSQLLEELRAKGLFDDVVVAGRVAVRGGDTIDYARALYQSGVSLDAIRLVMPDIPELGQLSDDPLDGLSAKISDKTPDADIVAVVTGTPQNRRAPAFATLEDFFENAVDNVKSYEDLPGPARQIFTSIRVNRLGIPVADRVEVDAKGNERLKEVELRSPKDIQAELQRVKSALVDKLVAPDSKKSRKQVEAYMDKVVDKFSDEFRRQFLSKEQRDAEEQGNSFGERVVNRLLKAGSEGFSQTLTASLLRKSGEGYRQARRLLRDLTTDESRDEGEPEDIGELEEWLKTRPRR